MVRIAKPKAIVLDLDGTITSIKFWPETLLPFIKTHTKKCLKERWGANEVIEVVNRLRRRTTEDRIRGDNSNKYLLNLIVAHISFDFAVPVIADEGSSRDGLYLCNCNKNSNFEIDFNFNFANFFI